MSRKISATVVEPDHEEDYDSDEQKPQPQRTLSASHGLGERRLSRVEDARLRTALNIVRSGSQRELKEECLRTEWYSVTNETEKEILKECVADEAFWEEVKELARKELAAEPEVMGEEQFRAMFREFDADNSGAIDAGELRKLLQQAMGMDCTHEEVIDLMAQVDTDGNGEIDEQEFLDIMNAAKKQQESSGFRARLDELEEASPLGKARKRRQSAFDGPSPASTSPARRGSPGVASPNVAPASTPVDAASPFSPVPKMDSAAASPRGEAYLGHRSDDEDERPATRLRRKASMTTDKKERVTLMGKATVEEYKEMLKVKAQEARRQSVAAREQDEQHAKLAREAERAEAELAAVSVEAPQRPARTTAPAAPAAAAAAATTTTTPAATLDRGDRSERSAERSVPKVPSGAVPGGLSLSAAMGKKKRPSHGYSGGDGGGPVPAAAKMTEAPPSRPQRTRAGSAKAGAAPNFMRGTASSKPKTG